MADIDMFMQDVRDSVHRILQQKKGKQPKELTDMIISEIRRSVKKLVSKEAPIITLTNAKIYVENGKLNVEAWDTDFSVNMTHTEFDTGHVKITIALAREDIDKLFELLTLKTSKELHHLT